VKTFVSSACFVGGDLLKGYWKLGVLCRVFGSFVSLLEFFSIKTLEGGPSFYARGISRGALLSSFVIVRKVE